MLTSDAAIKMIVDALEAQLELDGVEPEDPLGADTVLLGENSPIDSLGLVNVIIEVEQGVADEYGAAIIVVDERAMSLANSPFRTVDTLATYVTELVAEASA